MLPQRFYVSASAGIRRPPRLRQPHAFHPNALLPISNSSPGRRPAEAPPANPQARQQTLDLAARMRAMWK
jgi:hypothetical protein